MDFGESSLDQHQCDIVFVNLYGQVAAAANHVLDRKIAPLADYLLSNVFSGLERERFFYALAAADPGRLDPSEVGNAFIRLLASNLLDN